MRSKIRYFAGGAILLAMIGSLEMRAFASNDDILPQVVQAQIPVVLQKVGSGTYRKFGFKIYYATLWAPNGNWDAAGPYALQLRYARSLSKDTLSNSIVDDLRDQGVVDEDTMAHWTESVRQIIPAVEDGDVMVALKISRKEAVLFLNGAEFTRIHDQAFSQAFFDIWLGKGADEDLRNELLEKTE